MPQVIAVRSGATSVVWSGVNMTTLFTQSTGIATRVILNSLQIIKTGVTGQPNIAFYHYSASMGTYNIIGAVQNGANNSGSGISIFPGNTRGPITTSGINGANYAAIQYLYSDRGNSVPMSDENNNTYQAGLPISNSVIFYFPANFWIGAGDTIAVKGAWHTSNTGTCYWSFTTITET